jgi:DNA topoisomerase-2
MKKSINESDDLTKTYIKLTPREHILKRPGMYISSTDFKLSNLFIFDNERNDIINKEIMFNEGLYKIIDEIITNAIDQTIKDKTLTLISTKISSNSIMIFNNGKGVDIEIHPIYNIYIPQLIFSELLSSTNYNDEIGKVVGGTYGIGIKLSVIFSKKFELHIWDAKRKLYYYQVYENNLSKISKPIIKKYKIINDSDINIDNKYLKDGGVKIIIYPDFEKFNSTNLSEDMKSLIKRRIMDLIVLTKKNVDIIIDNVKINRGSNIESYLNLFNMEVNENNWIIGHCIKNLEWQYAIKLYKNVSNINLTFVNSIYTNRGGTHLNYFVDLIFERIKKMVDPQLTKKILLDNIIIFLKTTIINPLFSSQSKEELTTPIKDFGYECDIPESFFHNLKESSLIKNLKDIVSQSNLKILSKLDGSKKSKIKFIPKLEDANFAGTKKSIECTLILTEGDSAKSTALAGLSQNDRNYYGVYPLRGKLLNVRDASINQINNNQEIMDITKIMGLKLKTNYTKDNINELRYGSIMIMTDADEDGSHIKGLIINYLDFFYPSLLFIKNFLKILATPLIKATYKNQLVTFSNIREYDKWKINIFDLHLWKIKYYKGLGTSTSSEALEYFKNIESNLIYLYNLKDNDLLLAFSKHKIDERKKWLLKYNPDNILDITKKNISIKEFVNNELIHFSNYDNIRSIPSIFDGLKVSQRKILFTCLKKNINNEIKVSILASLVSETTSYHHGENSLILTIINLAQNYVGSNNINILKPIGQFGSRIMSGKDHASARYIFTHLEKIMDSIFIKDDNDLLHFLTDENILVEPQYYLPIIPMILINGCEGIGTGFSTNIPCYNPTDIINWLINKLNGIKNKKELIPFYRNFKGKIFKYDKDTWISEGLIEFHKNEIHILELPIKLNIFDYKLFLEDIISKTIQEKNNIFRYYINLSNDTDIKFILKYDKEKHDDIIKMYNTIDSFKMNNLFKYLSLYKTIKQSNMHLYTENNTIKKFNNADEIINEFYSFRLPFYNERKKIMLSKINKNIKFIKNQVNFIKLIINKGQLLKLENIESYLKKNKFDLFDNSYDYLLNLSFKQMNNLKNLEFKLSNYKKEYKELLTLSSTNMYINDLNNLKNLL